GGRWEENVTIEGRLEMVSEVMHAKLSAVPRIKNDKAYALEFMKGPYLDLGKERDRFTERAYEAAVQGYLLSGIVDEKLQREMIAVAAQRVKLPQPVAPERVFDFSFARNASETLR